MGWKIVIERPFQISTMNIWFGGICTLSPYMWSVFRTIMNLQNYKKHLVGCVLSWLTCTTTTTLRLN